MNLGGINGRKVFLLTFIYTLILTSFFQVIFLGVMFPELNAGNGLMIGGDWLSFHHYGVMYAENAKYLGYEAFSTIDSQYRPSYFVGLIYYLLWEDPLALLPVFSLFNACTAFFIYKISCLLFKQEKINSLVLLPLFFAPSSMIWLAAPMKDSFVVPAVVGFVYYSIAQTNILLDKKKASIFYLATIAIIMTSCLFLLFNVRPYYLELYKILFFVFFLFLILFSIIKHKLNFIRQSYKFFPVLIGLFLIFQSPQSILIPIEKISRHIETANRHIETANRHIETANRHIETVNRHIETVKTPNKDFDVNNLESLDLPISSSFKSSTNSAEENYPVDEGGALLLSKIYKYLRVRNAFIKSMGSDGTNVKSNTATDDIQLHTFQDAIFYLPKATYVALLAPNPYTVLNFNGKTSAMLDIYFLVIETLISFIGIVSFLVFFVRYIRNPNLIPLIIFVIPLLFLYAYILPNYGTLLRMKFPYILIISSIGILFLIMKFKKNK